MNFNDYQTKSRGTAKYPAIGLAVIYPTLGLVNEAGEVTWKKAKDSVVLDTAKLLADQPDLLKHYGQQRQGSRRFVLA